MNTDKPECNYPKAPLPTGAPLWARLAAREICELDGIRPHLEAGTGAGEVYARMSHIIAGFADTAGVLHDHENGGGR